MRMPAYQLLVERSAYVVDIEARCTIAHPTARTGTAVSLNLRVKNYLFKYVAKLFFKVLRRALSNRFDRLVGLLNHVL